MAEIVLASCNEAYHKLYGAIFEQSLQKLNQPYHIEMCDDEPPSDWIDPNPMPRHGHYGTKKSWYACNRYLVLPEMIEEHGGVFVSDIDIFFFRPIQFPTQSIGYVKTEPKPFRTEWEQRGMHVLAGFFYCSDVDIATQIRNRILELPKRWFVDQIAIHEVMVENASKLKYDRFIYQKPPTKPINVLDNDFALVPRGTPRGKTNKDSLLHSKWVRDQLL